MSKLKKNSQDSAQSRLKQLKSTIAKQYYDPPLEKQFIAFSLILKQSKNGFNSNQRLLLFDSKNKILMYLKDVPQQLPSTTKQLPEGKQIIHIKKTRLFSFKSTRSGIGKVKVQWLDHKGVKNIWNISFSSNQIMNQWVLMVNQVIKDGHLNPQNRPKSTTRRDSKVHASRYMTQFMKETTKNDKKDSNSKETSRESSINKVPFWAKNLQKQQQIDQQHKNNAEWLLGKVAEKQREFNQNVKRRQIQQQVQRQQKQKQQQKQRQLGQSNMKIENQQPINKNISQLKPKTLQQQFFTRKSIHRGRKAEIQHMKQKQPSISRQEQFRKKLIEKALSRSKVNHSQTQSSNSKKNKMKQYTVEDPLVQQSKQKNITDVKQQINNKQMNHSKKPQSQYHSAIQRSLNQKNKSPNKSNIEKQQEDKPQNIKIMIPQTLEHSKDKQPEIQKIQNPSNFRYSTPQNNNQFVSPRSRQSSFVNNLQQQKFRQRVKSVISNYPNHQEHPPHRYQTHYKNHYASHPYIQTAYTHPGLINSTDNYKKFIKASQQISQVLVDKLPQVLNQAIKNPSQKLYIEQIKWSDSNNKQIYLNIVKQCVEYRIQLEIQDGCITPCKQFVNNWYGGAFKMQQYTSIVKYIRQMIRRGRLNNYNNSCIIIPYCLLTYKWNLIQCKSTIPQCFTILTNQESQLLNKQLQVPPGTWNYYVAKNQSSQNKDILLIDFAIRNLQIQTDLPLQVIDDLVFKLRNQAIVCSSIADLSEQLHFTYSATLNQQILHQLLKRLNRSIYLSSTKHTKTFSICLLYSILYGIKCGQYIQKVLRKHMLDMETGQLYENIDQLIKLALIRNDSQYSNHVSTAIMEKYRQTLQYNNVRYSESQQIIDNIVLSTILYVLGLHIIYKQQPITNKHTPSQSSSDLSITAMNQQGKHLYSHGSKYILQFIIQREHIDIQGISQHLQSVKKILLQIAKQQDNQQQKYTHYLQMQQYLNKHNNQQIKKQSTANIAPNKKNSNHHHYLNLKTRINLFRSIYTPTMNISLPNQKSNQFSAIIWQQPPNRFSYLLGINCTKWTIKNGSINYQTILQIIRQQIRNCQIWGGPNNYYLILFYQLISLYCSQIYDYDAAIYYIKLCLGVVQKNYGQNSSNAIQRWYLLANTQLQAELYEESIASFQTSLNLLIKKQLETKQSQNSLLSINTQNMQVAKNAEYQLRNKIADLYLAIGNISQCLQQSLLCLKLYQNIINQNQHFQQLQRQLQILFRISKCYEIDRNTDKVYQIINIIGTKFPANILQTTKNSEQLIKQHTLQQNILKMCIYPYFHKNDQYDRNRRQFFVHIIKKISRKYRNRYLQSEYHLYLTKWVNNYHSSQTRRTSYKYGIQRTNVFQKLRQLFLIIPIFDIPETALMEYSLYNENQRKVKDQRHIIVIQGFRMLEVIGHIVGFTYLRNCFE